MNNQLTKQTALSIQTFSIVLGLSVIFLSFQNCAEIHRSQPASVDQNAPLTVSRSVQTILNRDGLTGIAKINSNMMLVEMSPPTTAANETYSAVLGYIWLSYMGPTQLNTTGLIPGHYYNTTITSGTAGQYFHNANQFGCTVGAGMDGTGELLCEIQLAGINNFNCATQGIASNEKYCFRIDLSRFFVSTTIYAGSIGFSLNSNTKGMIQPFYSWSRIGALVTP